VAIDFKADDEAAYVALRDARAAVLASPNATVTVLGRTYTRHNVAELSKELETVRARVTAAQRGGRRWNRVIPL
jgi:hypothetical protein